MNYFTTAVLAGTLVTLALRQPSAVMARGHLIRSPHPRRRATVAAQLDAYLEG